MQKENNIYRYYYYEELEAKNSLHAIVIMMNPAFADSEESDDTIKNIKKYLGNENNKFGSFGIINLYPIRMPKSETEKYHEFIKSYLKENCKDHIIIAAWGSDKEDNELACNLFKNLNIKFYCYGLTKEGYPKHFSSQSFNNFNKFRYPFPYIKINNWLKDSHLSEYDKEKLIDVKNLKQWLNCSPSVSQNYVNYMLNLLNDVFAEVE